MEETKLKKKKDIQLHLKTWNSNNYQTETQ